MSLAEAPQPQKAPTSPAEDTVLNLFVDGKAVFYPTEHRFFTFYGTYLHNLTKAMGRMMASPDISARQNAGGDVYETLAMMQVDGYIQRISLKDAFKWSSSYARFSRNYIFTARNRTTQYGCR